MTIEEFLLARIAEDEGEADRWAFDLGGGDWDDLRDRVLAECESKRRIVSFSRDNAERYPDPYATEEVWPDVLKALALPYADHADYDPAWGE